MRRVLGVDPGSAATGWALVRSVGSRNQLEELGVIRARGDQRPQRLADLAGRFSRILERLKPDAAAVEASFSGRNPRSGLMLAESRGVLLAELGRAEIDVVSFSPAEIKASIVGHGRAEKQQVAFMVTRLLGIESAPPADAADAAAVALTYLHTRRWRELS